MYTMFCHQNLCTDIQVLFPKLVILARHVAMSLHLRLGLLTSIHQMYCLHTAKIRSCFNLGVVISAHLHTLAQHSLHTTTITVISSF